MKNPVKGQADVAEDWKKRGYSCGLWVDPRGQVWEDFTHDTDELLMLVEGEIEVEIRGQKTRPKPGEEVLIPQGAIHSVRNLGKGESRWLYGYRH